MDHKNKIRHVKMSKLKHIILLLIGFVLLNIICDNIFIRWDLTADKRFSLSQTTKQIVKKVDKDLLIKVYLKGDFPLDFKRLQLAVKQHLEELKSKNKHIHFTFIKPQGLEQTLIDKGMQASQLTVEKDGVLSEQIFFPWAEITYDNKTAIVDLLADSGIDQESSLQNAIENLEYAFSEAVNNLVSEKKNSIAVLKGNQELEDIYLYDFLNKLSVKYRLAPFTLAKQFTTPQELLKDISAYDLLIIAKPQKAFSASEKLILDQYIMQGGKTLWMIDHVFAEMDSLRTNGEALFLNRALNITDLLFSYGARINHNLVKDLYGSKIAVATGKVGDKTQFSQYVWPYYPLVTPEQNNPIGKNLAPVNLKFPSSIDTLPNDIKKTVLLKSSKLSKIVGLPGIVSLNSIAEKVDFKEYKSGGQILSVILEGNFNSAYNIRSRAFETDFISKSKPSKMIIISDGDIAANQIQDGQPTSLNSDKWTGQRFGNRDFLLNAVDYLLDETGLINLRSRSLEIAFLNKEKVANERYKWQFINIILPILLLLLFSLAYTYLRKRKYQL